jgi:hypothetical protein
MKHKPSRSAMGEDSGIHAGPAGQRKTPRSHKALRKTRESTAHTDRGARVEDERPARRGDLERSMLGR